MIVRYIDKGVVQLQMGPSRYGKKQTQQYSKQCIDLYIILYIANFVISQ